MRTQLIRLLLPVALLLVLLPAAAQDDAAPSPFQAMLRYVPDTPETRAWLTWGDYAAWLRSWEVPPITNLDALDALPRDPHADWLFVMPRQTTPPDVLGINYLFAEGEARRAFYGFDIFDLTRWLDAGNPPDGIAVVEHALDPAQIGAALEASGYMAEPFGEAGLFNLSEAAGTLYSIREDYAIDMEADLRSAMLGQRNRIALLNDGTMLIGRATAPVMAAISARTGETTSLADAPEYAALATALYDPALADLGAFVGVVVSPGSGHEDAPTIAWARNERFSSDEALFDRLIEDLRATSLYGDVPEYLLAGFATYHSAAVGASFLTLALVLPADSSNTDLTEGGLSLATRLSNYRSMYLAYRSIAERWSLERIDRLEARGLPVLVVSMRVDDPPIAPEGEQPNTAVWNWWQMIVQRDLLFLATDAE